MRVRAGARAAPTRKGIFAACELVPSLETRQQIRVRVREQGVGRKGWNRGGWHRVARAWRALSAVSSCRPHILPGARARTHQWVSTLHRTVIWPRIETPLQRAHERKDARVGSTQLLSPTRLQANCHTEIAVSSQLGHLLPCFPASCA